MRPSAAGNFAIDPLLLQGVQEHVQQYTGFESYAGGELLGIADVDMQYLVAGTGSYSGLQGGAFHAALGPGDDESMRQCGLRWLPNGLA